MTWCDSNSYLWSSIVSYWEQYSIVLSLYWRKWENKHLHFPSLSHTYVHSNMYVYIQKRIYTYMYMYKYIHTCIHMYIHIHLYIYNTYTIIKTMRFFCFISTSLVSTSMIIVSVKLWCEAMQCYLISCDILYRSTLMNNKYWSHQSHRVQYEHATLTY